MAGSGDGGDQSARNEAGELSEDRAAWGSAASWVRADALLDSSGLSVFRADANIHVASSGQARPRVLR